MGVGAVEALGQDVAAAGLNRYAVLRQAAAEERVSPARNLGTGLHVWVGSRAGRGGGGGAVTSPLSTLTSWMCTSRDHIGSMPSVLGVPPPPSRSLSGFLAWIARLDIEMR